jgi:hypothetical protein
VLIAIPFRCHAQSPCDPELLQQSDPTDIDRYSQRGKDRCEGIYLQKVSSSALKIAARVKTHAEDKVSWWFTKRIGSCPG